ncbi:MAG: GNVR domain-containing protein [Patescibacteria group bacterium]
MSQPNYIRDVTNHWHTVVMFGLLGLVLALIVSFVQPLRYSSTVRLLILQDVGSSVDAYTASRAEERIADNLSTLLYTSTFFGQVMNAGFDIDQTIFPDDDSKTRKVWGNMVRATVSRGSGLLSVTAYHRDITQAEQIVRAIAVVLTEHVDEYTSGGSVAVRLVDEPLNSRWPVKPNILVNILSGFVLGGFVGIGFVILQTERIRRRHQLVHEEF